MEKVIKLPVFGIVVKVNGDPYGYGTIKSELHQENPTSAIESAMYSFAMDALESIILAHACAGVDISSPAYVEGIETAVNFCVHNI